MFVQEYKNAIKKDFTSLCNCIVARVHWHPHLPRQSLKNAQSFAINEDLTPLKSLEGGDDEILNVINIEAIRIKAGNELRNLKEQEKQLINIQNDPEALIFFAKNVQGNTQIFNILKKL